MKIHSMTCGYVTAEAEDPAVKNDFFISANSIVDQLRKLGFRPDDIQIVVVSHFHFDHVGGVRQFPNAQILVQKREWDVKHADEFVEIIRFVSSMLTTSSYLTDRCGG